MSDAPPNPAEVYQRFFVPAMFVPWSALLTEHAAPQIGEHALDIACGTGAVTRRIAPLLGASGQITGLDLSPAMLAVAREQPPVEGAAIIWQEGNAEQLPFADAQFDLITCQHGLPFVPNKAAAVQEIRRVLRPGGRAAILVLRELERHPVFAAVGTVLARQLQLPVERVMVPFSMADRAAFHALCAAAGFNDLAIHDVAIEARFAETERFVPLMVISTAAAVPAFAQLDGPARQRLIAEVSTELAPLIASYRDGDTIAFPVYGQLALARTAA